LKEIKKDIKKDYLSEEQLLLYKEGKLNPTEMRQVEGLLEKYPLYAEALEGLSLLDSNKIAQDVSFLRENIRIKTAQKQRKHIFLSRTAMMRIAATITILLVGTSVFYFLNREESTQMMNKEMAVNSTPTPESIPSDLSPASEAQAGETVELPQERNQGNKYQNPIQGDKKEMLREREVIQLDKTMAEDDGLIAISSQEAKKDTNLAPLARIEAENNAKNDKLTDKKDKDIIHKPAPVSPTTISKGGEEKEESVAKKDEVIKEEEVAIDRAEQVSKEKESKHYEVAKKKNKNSAEPLPNADDLLKTHLYNFAKSKNEAIKGKLSITFSLDKKGRARNISVIESPCLSCSEEAIRWVQSYKRWEKEADKQKNIEIIFSND
jgi:hypothetical protein